MICVAGGSEQAPDDRAQSCCDFCVFSSLAAWPGRMNPPVIAHCVSEPPPSPSSSPPTPRAENLGKAFPQTSFNLGLHTFRVEINPWKSWGKERREAQHPLRVFLQTSESAFFSCSAHPIPPTVALQPFSLCPDLGAGMLSAASAFPPSLCLPRASLPEVMEIRGAGAVLVLVEVGSRDGSWGHLLITISIRVWHHLVSNGTKFPRLLPGRDRSREVPG